MKRTRPLLLFSLFVITSMVVLAQTQFGSWPFFAEVRTTPTADVYKVTIPLQVMGHARDDLGDIRLFDDQREIPYAIRVRNEVNERREFGVNIFNRVTAGSATEVSVDVGQNAGEHNEVEVHTTGYDFRRRVVIEGSDSGSDWRTLKSDAVIFGFQSGGKSVESNRVSYPTSRYRYLRVRVMADEYSDDEAPRVTEVKVIQAVHEDGVLSTWDVIVPEYQLLRNQGAHASSWTIDFGSRLPCSQLAINILDPSFYRPFQVEAVDDPQNPRLIASGNLSRRAGENEEQEIITFDQEQHVQKIRLQITNYSNPTLSIEAIQASAAAREMVFELKQVPAHPLRLFFGNHKVSEPHYDFEKEVTAKLLANPIQSSVGNISNNPSYTPEPKPFTERVPWLIYLVLAGSSVALGWILWSLARTALRREPQEL
jgi:hypothetical protein